VKGRYLIQSVLALFYWCFFCCFWYITIDHNLKRDDFNFPFVNFPFMCSNIPVAPAYGVYISHLIRYSRACASYQDVIGRGLMLTRKILNQGFLKDKQRFTKYTYKTKDRVTRTPLKTGDALMCSGRVNSSCLI
jgi:hypothetical protein